MCGYKLYDKLTVENKGNKACNQLAVEKTRNTGCHCLSANESEYIRECTGYKGHRKKDKERGEDRIRTFMKSL